MERSASPDQGSRRQEKPSPLQRPNPFGGVADAHDHVCVARRQSGGRGRRIKRTLQPEAPWYPSPCSAPPPPPLHSPLCVHVRVCAFRFGLETPTKFGSGTRRKEKEGRGGDVARRRRNVARQEAALNMAARRRAGGAGRPAVILVWAGLHAYVSGCQWSECGSVLTEPEGQLTSPCYPSKYGNSASCRWSLRAPPGFVVQIRFEDFEL
ncbi:discoidin, CUB and LCCL domain-containing protein 2-like, partial [Hippocampus comes]|uniref:discoidin, CUB and LCCL domain-containing protein 2-like n=1 Tax=Hippocampus comes TaxID=109280 RepID=UPI00094E3A33